MTSAIQKKTAYTPRRPEDSLLYKVINDSRDEFLRSVDSDPDSRGMPKFVRKEFEKFLGCGFYENGVTRISCKDGKCGEDYWLPTSCKCRGFCPSCGGRRMNEFAINLDERVIPDVPVRQYVVSVPIPLRYLMISNHELTLVINRLIINAIRALLRKKSRKLSVDDGVIGAVTFLQRFGSGLNLHLHYHILVLDGVFKECPDDIYVPEFVPTPDITDADIGDLVRRVSRSVTKYLVRERILEEITLHPAEGIELSLNQDGSEALSACKSASVASRIAFGIRSGKKVRRVGANMFGYGKEKGQITGPLCASYGGFSVHANREVKQYEREELKKLITYIARPAVALDRLSFTDSGDIKVELKTPWPDGSTAIVLSQMELLEKLAALVPYPEKNLVIYSGCLAPNHKMRTDIVPTQNSATPTPGDSASPVEGPPKPRNRHIPWAELLKKTFEIDVFSCRKCGGPTKVMAFIGDPREISKIMKAFKLHSPPPPRSASQNLVYEFEN